jgi:tRNA threonylcarbamoyladenosine biosynthesis protein TsaE
LYPLVSENLGFISYNMQQTVQFGARLGELLVPGDVICLSGEMGAGKTALTSGIATGWRALEPVNSPTFVFVHAHRRSQDALSLFHLDCYRLNSHDDALSIGVEDILSGQDVVVVEWPEKIEWLLPVERLWINLETLADADWRAITLKAVGVHYQQLLEALATARDH